MIGLISMAVTLSTNPARPLTSREISKVLLSILGGVYGARNLEARDFERVVRGTLYGSPTALEDAPGHVTWRTAFVATAAGFFGWCSPNDVTTALSWLLERVAHIYPAPPAN